MQGCAVIFHRTENKMSCFSVLGLARKVLGVGVLGLQYHVQTVPKCFIHFTLGTIRGVNVSFKIHVATCST